MADNQTTVALNIGSQRIGMAVFEVSKNGSLVLTAYDSESIVADPALDASRISQTRVAIADLAQRLKVGKTKARYAISGQSVFTRFVKLPPLQDDNIEQFVTFEAQQHVPFPLAEVVWDYETHRRIDRKGSRHRRHQGGRPRRNQRRRQRQRSWHCRKSMSPRWPSTTLSAPPTAIRKSRSSSSTSARRPATCSTSKDVGSSPAASPSAVAP